MHVVIINGSPRTQQHSNTHKIVKAFVKGIEAEGCTYQYYTLSSRKEWDAAREAYINNEHIIFALPMYVESIPSLMLEFLDTLPACHQWPAEVSFIVHGGFDEGYQFRFCERLLQQITEQLGCSYGGCLIKGGSFMLRLFDDKKTERMTTPFAKMGKSYARNGYFLTTEARRFTGPERYPWLVRQIAGMFLKLIVNRKFKQFAKDWGCSTPLDMKRYLIEISSFSK